MGIVPCFDLISCPVFRADFRLAKEGIWTSFLLVNCRFNFELEIRLLNYPNWTSIAQFMVRLISGIVKA